MEQKRINSDNETEKRKTCGECEFFGFYTVPVLSEYKEIRDGEKIRFYRDFIGFDESKGACCLSSGHRPINVRIYKNSDACCNFKQKEWLKARNCNECKLLNFIDREGFVHCTGYPFYRKKGTDPCENGRCYIGENMRLF